MRLLPWRAQPSNNMANQEQLKIKLVTTHPSPWYAVKQVSAHLSQCAIRTYGVVQANHNPNIFFIKLPTVEMKEKVLTEQSLPQILNRWGFAPLLPHVSAEVANRTAFGTNSVHRMVFVNALSPLYFQCFTAEETGEEEDDTLQGKMDELTAKIKQTPEGAEIEDIHFNRQYDRQIEIAPRTCLITFQTVVAAQAFINTETTIPLSCIKKSNKKFHVAIRIKQCLVCKQTNHRKGDRMCSLQYHCSRCWSTSHSAPLEEQCDDICWNCGPGHISGSNRCPLNRAYVREERAKLADRNRISNRIRDTPSESRAFHADLLRHTSYASRFRQRGQPNQQGPRPNHTPHQQAPNFPQPGPQPGHQPGPQPQIPPPPPPPTVNSPMPGTPPITSALSSATATAPQADNTLSSRVMRQAYIAACIDEALIPGSFQDTMESYYNINNIPLIKFPTPNDNIIRRYSNEAVNPPAQQNNTNAVTASPLRTVSPTLITPRSSPQRTSPRLDETSPLTFSASQDLSLLLSPGTFHSQSSEVTALVNDLLGDPVTRRIISPISGTNSPGLPDLHHIHNSQQAGGSKQNTPMEGIDEELNEILANSQIDNTISANSGIIKPNVTKNTKKTGNTKKGPPINPLSDVSQKLNKTFSDPQKNNPPPISTRSKNGDNHLKIEEAIYQTKYYPCLITILKKKLDLETESLINAETATTRDILRLLGSNTIRLHPNSAIEQTFTPLSKDLLITIPTAFPEFLTTKIKFKVKNTVPEGKSALP